MSLCCHNDYTLTNDINISDVNILAAFQSWLDMLGDDADESNKTLEKFKEYYADQVSKGLLPELSNEVKSLPDDPKGVLDCSNFTQTGYLSASDVNIFSAYQSWIHQKGSRNPNTETIEQLETYYQTQVDRGLLPLYSPKRIMHLPTLDSENYITTREDGRMLKDCCVDCDTWLGEHSYTYNLKSGEIEPAIYNLSAEWYNGDYIPGKLCFGESDPELPKTYYAFFPNVEKPVGAITISGKFIDEERIFYTQGDLCLVGTPDVMQAPISNEPLKTQEIDVYNFEYYIKDTDPAPTPTATPSYTPTPTPTQSPTITHTSTEEQEHEPSPTETYTPTPSPSPSPSPSETPTEIELDCCETLTTIDVDKTKKETYDAGGGITMHPFKYNGTLCVGTLTQEGPVNSLELYMESQSTENYVGTLGLFGYFDDSNKKVVYKINDTIYNSEEICVEGNINGKICILKTLE